MFLNLEKECWLFFSLNKASPFLLQKLFQKITILFFFQSTIYFLHSLNRVLTFYILFLFCLSFCGQRLEEGQRAQYSQRVLSSLKFFHNQRIYIELFGEKPSTLLLIFPVFYSKCLMVNATFKSFETYK